MKRKKLLYVGNALSSSGKTVTTIETLSKLLVQESYEVTVTSSKANKMLRMLDMIHTLCTFRNKVDVVLIDTYSTSNFWYAVIIAWMCRNFTIPYIPILHGGNLPQRLVENEGMCKKLFGGAHVNVAPSAYLYSAFAKAGFSKIIYIPNTIEIDKYPFKERLQFEPKLLWVRSFSKIYNPLMAVEVLDYLIDTYPNAMLTMVGPDKDGSLNTCKKYASDNSLPVLFTGKLAKAEWVKLAQEHDIFINTTDFDNTPVSIIEAMALGLPVTSTNVGGMPFLINDGIDGLLSPPNAVESFSKKIILLLENSNKTQQMVIAARHKAKSFDWSVVKETWNNVFLNL